MHAGHRPNFGGLNEPGEGFGGMGGMGQRVYENNFNQQYMSSGNSAKSSKAGFSVVAFILVLLYSYGLVYLTLVVMLVRKRLQTYLRLPVVLYYTGYYLLNLMVLRVFFGYHFFYQTATTVAMGYVLVRYKNLNVIGLTGRQC